MPHDDPHADQPPESDGARADVDPELESLARSIAHHLAASASETDPMMRDRVRQRLAQQIEATSETEALRRAAHQRRAHRIRRSALVAAVIAIIALIVGVQAWPQRAPVATAADILSRAEGAVFQTRTFRSFVITEETESRQDPLTGVGGGVRGQITRWYEAPGRWRRETVSRVLDAQGTVIGESGLTSISDGETVWIHRTRDNTVVVRPASAAPRTDELGPVPEVTGGLSALLARARVCYEPRREADELVAGRPVYVVSLGRSRCAPDTLISGVEAGSAADVEWTVWVDTETFVILKSVQQVDGEIIARTVATSVRYNQPSEPERFRFTPPPGARIRDLRPPATGK